MKKIFVNNISGRDLYPEYIRKSQQLLNTKGIKEENTREDRKYFEMDEKRNHKYRNYGMQLK